VKKFCSFLFELTNEDRLAILLQLDQEAMKVTHLSIELGFTAQGCGCNVSRAREQAVCFDEKIIDWASFRKFLEKTCTEKVVNDRLRYARKYSHCLFKRNFSELNTFSDAKRSHVLNALSGLAKFIGMYVEFRRLVNDYGLKWKTTNADDLIISRLTRASQNYDVIKWIKTTKIKRPKLSVVFDFAMISGLRYGELVKAYNLIIDLAKKGRLNEYYDAETEALEHFRFKQLFIRRTKKVFISFVPKTFINRISNQRNLTIYQIDGRIRRNGFKSRFSDIREYYATFMTKYLTQSEIDFLQGRVLAKVFMRNYFNPTLIADLRERTFKGIAQIQQKL